MAPFVWNRDKLAKLLENRVSAPRSRAVLTGRLERSSSGWGLLVVPNAILNGLFSSLPLPGIEKPKGPNGRVNAHISVFRDEELSQIEKDGKVTEFGKPFTYQLGELQEVVPVGWEEVEKCWFLRVKSPALEKLRKSYGLTPLPQKQGMSLPFHLTIAIRKKGVLNKNQIRKTSSVNWLVVQDTPIQPID